MAAKAKRKEITTAAPPRGRKTRKETASKAGTSAELRAAALLHLVDMIDHPWPAATGRVFKLPPATFADANPAVALGERSVKDPEQWLGRFLLGDFPKLSRRSSVASAAILCLGLTFEDTVMALARIAVGELVPGMAGRTAEV